MYIAKDNVRDWVADDKAGLLEVVKDRSLLLLYPTKCELGNISFPSPDTDGPVEMERHGDEMDAIPRRAQFRVLSRFNEEDDETASLGQKMLQWQQVKTTNWGDPTLYSPIGRIKCSEVAKAFTETAKEKKYFRRIEAYVVNIAGYMILVCPADDSDGGS